MLNFGGFFALLYVTALWLPSSVASSIMALAPLVLAACGWALLGERPTSWMAVGAGVGIVGVLLIVGAGAGAVNPWGVLTSLVALVMSSIGAVLNKKWSAGLPLLPITAWQATIGGLVLVVVAGLVEGPPPVLGGAALAGFAYISLIATALASLCWFGGWLDSRRAPSGSSGCSTRLRGFCSGCWPVARCSPRSRSPESAWCSAASCWADAVVDRPRGAWLVDAAVSPAREPKGDRYFRFT